MSQADLEVAMSQGWGSQASTVTPFYAVLGSKPELQTSWSTTLTTELYPQSLSGSKTCLERLESGKGF